MSAVMVHVSHGYKNMDMARECISLTLKLMAMFLSFQMTFSLVTAAVALGYPREYFGLGFFIRYYIASWLPTMLHVERLLEVHEDIAKVLLVLQVFLTEYSKTENLLSCTPSYSEVCLFFFDDFLSFWLQSIQEDS